MYSLATFCPACGRLAPAQQLAELIQVERDRLDSFDQLDAQTRRRFIENGVVSTTYEATIKNGFTALETYLKDNFTRNAASVQKAPSSTTFQRLDDANLLYRTHLGIDLAATVGADVWTELQRAAAIRHVLIHNNGVVDDKFLQRLPNWPQALGQRITIRKQDSNTFLDALTTFAERVIGTN